MWCGSGVVSVSLSRTIIDYMGLSRILQDTAMAYQTNILKSLLTVFFHNRQGSPFHFMPHFTLVRGQVRNILTADVYLHILKNIVPFTTPILFLSIEKAVNPKPDCFVCMDMKLSNWNSDKTFFIALINCYILSSKSPQILENAKFIASEFALRLSLVLYPFPSCYKLS